MEMQELRSFIPAMESVTAFKAYKCSICNRIYSTQVHASVVSGRIPLLMPCSHTVCEECFIRMSKAKKINCVLCQYDINLENLEVNSTVFPVDRYIFGSLMHLNLNVANNIRGVADKNVLHFVPAGSSMGRGNKSLNTLYVPKAAPEPNARVCTQSGCTKRAEFRCISCREIYCAKCDRRVHESVKVLRNHTRYPIDIADLTEFNVLCVAHSNSCAEYSCSTCGTMLCSKCVIKDHQGHEVTSVEEKNAQELEPFKETLKKAKHVLRCMESTKKKVATEIKATHLNKPNGKRNNIEYQVMKHFSTLHSRLQLMEQSILEQLNSVETAKVDTLQHLSNELATSISILQPLVATGTMVAHEGNEHLDKLVLGELERNITQNLNLPCKLVEENREKEESIQFLIDQSFNDSLKNHCKIHFEHGLSFKLSPMTDFTEENVLFTNESASASSDCESSLSVDSCTSHISYVQPGCKTRVSLAGSVPTMYGNVRPPSPPKRSNEPIVLVKGTKETVTVTHVTNPGNFYVQLSRKHKEIEELSAKYELYAERAPIPTLPVRDTLYIVQFTSQKITKWYRAILKDIHTTGVTLMYEVFYIDYGNSAMVPLSKIRVMNPIFMEDAPFAYKCQLNGIISQRAEWTDTVLLYMVKFITNNRNLQMHVIQNQKGVLDVDLYSHSQSLIMALIFMGFAQPMEHLDDIAKRRNVMISETKIASAMDNYQIKKTYPIKVTHVVNPHHIFVQHLTNEGSFKKLETAMTKHYSNKELRKMIFTPEKGMVCVAQLLSSNKKWLRVEIIDLPGCANVEVFSLDYGFTEIIPWNQLCKIKDNHKLTDAQAILVSLSDIEPPKQAKNVWPEETNTFLRKYLRKKNLTMVVNETSKEKLMVTMYEITDEADICIDALLVRKQLAESTGESSLLVEFHKILPGDSEEIFSRNLGQLNDAKPPKAEKSSKSAMCGKNFVVDVKIVKIESPGSFYVEIIKWTDEKIKMVKQMAQFYNTQISPARRWNLHEKCVVRCKDEKYYRAQVTKILEENSYEVFMNDFHKSVEVPTRDLYELETIFSTHDFIFHCCLGGVKPAGSSGKWPAKSIEVFEDFVEKYNNLFITKYGPAVDQMLSVQLLTSWEDSAGPLEPIKTNTIVLNESLLRGGLALPVKIDADIPNQDSVFGCKTELPDQDFTMKPFESETYLTPSSSMPASWLPPVNLPEKRFTATPTNVDIEGAIFIQTTKAKNLLQNINRILEKKFRYSIPEPHHKWEVGQMCTVLYELDNTFCRGTIVDIGEKFSVHLIDYGSREECLFDALRSEVLATDIPALAVKCRLSNVVPKTKDGSWPIPLLDRLHFTIVDKECEVELDNKNLSISEPYVFMYLNNECINTLCNTAEWSDKVQKNTGNVSASDDDMSVVIEDDVDVEIDEPLKEQLVICHERFLAPTLKFNFIELPKDLPSFKAVIINIIDYRSIVVETDFAGVILCKTREQFDAMSEEILKSGPKQPMVLSQIRGMPCIALFGDDEKWYRAEILDVMDRQAKEIKVFFVDYGNVEIVPHEDVRDIKKEWLDIPVTMLQFKIWGIRNVPDFDIMDVNTAMKETIVDKQVICEVKQYEPEVEVTLVDEESDELVYQYLLDNNVIHSVD